MKIYRKIIVCFLVLCLFLTLPVYASSISLQNEKAIQNEIGRDLNPEATKNFALNDVISADLKIRKGSGNWQDGSIKANVEDIIEFKITVTISRSYLFFGVLIELPTVGEDPMFDYISSDKVPWDSNDEEIRWNWLYAEPPWSEEITFTALIEKAGKKTIKLTAFGEYKGDDNKLHEDSATDSVNIDVEGTGKHMPITFPQNKVRLVYRFLSLKETKIAFMLSTLWGTYHHELRSIEYLKR